MIKLNKKSGNSAGVDNVTNTIIDRQCTESLPLYHKLFSSVLDTHFLITSW